MVNIDAVYQRVLALANKEQRGYITPQEFNLFANQAQMEILDQYFYDLNQTVTNVEPNSTQYSDMTTFIDEKLSVFKRLTTATVGGNGAINSPPGLYRWGGVYKDGVMYEEVDYSEYVEMSQSPLTKPTHKRPVYYFERTIQSNSNNNNRPVLKPTPIGSVTVSYVSTPAKAKWGYVVINDKAIYNASASTNFELHSSEETELVYKILKLGGISLNKLDLSQAALNLENSKVQQEKE